jgi:hypothetical protein
MNEETQYPHFISREEVIETIYKCWFITNLVLTSDKNTVCKYTVNKKLRQKYVDLYNKKNKITLNNFCFNPHGESDIPNPRNVTITFDAIKLYPNFKSILSKIIDEEIMKEEKLGFGSYREFKSLVMPKLVERIINRTMQEIWCVMIIKKNMNNLTKKWIENRFAPGGKGYLEAKKRFENNYY